MLEFFAIIFTILTGAVSIFYFWTSIGGIFNTFFSKTISTTSEMELSLEEELPKANKDTIESDTMSFMATSSDGMSLEVYMTAYTGGMAEIGIFASMEDGSMLSLPEKLVIGLMTQNCMWNSSGLKLTVLEPFLRWRIVFNGLMLDQDNKLVHARLNFIWATATKPLYFPKCWKNGALIGHLKHESGLAQFGFLQGELRLDEYAPKVMKLRGIRRRSTNEVATKETGKFERVLLSASANDGNLVLLDGYWHQNGKFVALGGSIRKANNTLEMIKKVKVTTSTEEVVYVINESFKLTMLTETKVGFEYISMFKNAHIKCFKRKLLIDETEGYGFYYTEEQMKGKKEEITSPPKPQILSWLPLENADSSAVCVSFEELSATCAQLVGAKGASLALLSSVKCDDKFEVPPGFCLTVNAFEQHTKSNAELLQSIANIEKCNINYDESAMKEACLRAVELFKKTEITGEVKVIILKYIEQLREKISADSKLTFAVRSSAIGEDSEELSAAGQNETILGCRTNDDILRAVQACWGSLFAFHSVTYRRMHGQPCKPGMGVVVQSVVRARAAGVMFSRHPTNGDPNTILITANYGLGESVVSGQIEPDSILLHRDINGNVAMKSKHIGGKTHRIEINNGKTEGDVLSTTTRTVALSDSERSEVCLSENECVKLAQVAVLIETLWAAPMDVEWAVVEDKMYLLQARPITTLDNWTEYELLHELDSPIMSDDDLHTFANTGEVLPGVLTPLTISVLSRALENGTVLVATGKPLEKFPEKPKFFITHHRFGINMQNTLYLRLQKKIDYSVRVTELAILGHTVLDDRLFKIALKHNSTTYVDQLATLYVMLKTLFNRKRHAKKAAKLMEKYKLDLSDTSSILEIFTKIQDTQAVMDDLFYYHASTTSSCMFSQIICLSVLVEKVSEFTVEHYNDFALMMSSCTDVISAEIPVALEKLASDINQTGRVEEFSNLPTDQCIPWLRENYKNIALKLEDFLERFAHRNIKEFEFSTKTWGIDPSSLLESLKATSKFRNGESKVKTLKTRREIIQELKSPKQTRTRILLTYLLPLCQSAVATREATKSLLIKSVHTQRLGYLQLGDAMVKDWYLPKRELVFYFTLYELATYINTRDPGLVKKALRRSQRNSAWEKQEFKEVYEGIVEPIVRQQREETAIGDKLHGTPICGGRYAARACVVHDLSEINQLQSGDILITHATDVGWSPYFPIIGGIVTELGGLISHGAVVAREYGLPSIIGVDGATAYFKTGDMLLLNADEGFIVKVEK